MTLLKFFNANMCHFRATWIRNYMLHYIADVACACGTFPKFNASSCKLVTFVEKPANNKPSTTKKLTKPKSELYVPLIITVDNVLDVWLCCKFVWKWNSKNTWKVCVYTILVIQLAALFNLLSVKSKMLWEKKTSHICQARIWTWQPRLYYACVKKYFQNK